MAVGWLRKGLGRAPPPPAELCAPQIWPKKVVGVKKMQGSILPVLGQVPLESGIWGFLFYLFFTLFFAISVGMQCSEAAPGARRGLQGLLGRGGQLGWGPHCGSVARNASKKQQ